MRQNQQTPVRFYITQNDDQPIVRTIPVASHPIPRVKAAAEHTPTETRAPQASRKVAKLVRFATRRSDRAQ